jgi:hypothetical protein
VLAVTAVYYLLPLGQRSVSGGVATVVFVAGIVVVVWAVVRQVRLVRTTGGHVAALLTVFYVAVVFFAATYYAVERTWPDQFENLATRTDALYFAVTVVATVGFGDVYAAGQAARVLVTVQMLFDIVVLGVAVTVVRSGGWRASE